MILRVTALLAKEIEKNKLYILYVGKGFEFINLLLDMPPLMLGLIHCLRKSLLNTLFRSH